MLCCDGWKSGASSLTEHVHIPAERGGFLAVSLSSAQRGYASALASVMIWALVPVGTRFFVLRVDPYVFNVIRFVACGCAALPLCAYAKPWRWPVSDRLLLLVCAVLSVPGYNIPVALGARTVPAGELAVLIATEPVMIAALSLMLEGRPLHGRVIGGSVLALLGVALTSGMFTAGPEFRLWGMLEVLAGAVSWSCYTVLAGRLNRRYGTFGVTGAIVVVGALVLLALSLPMMDPGTLPDLSTAMMLAAMGITTSLIGFLLWNYAGARVPAERLGLFLYMIPIASICAGVQFLAESLTLPMLLGGALVVAGVWIASRRIAVARPIVIE
jgi:drug/metabolite transporter (DMT)-like permease